MRIAHPAISLLIPSSSRAQYTVLQFLGVQKVHVVVGFSMGGQQAYHWAVIYPDYVERCALHDYLVPYTKALSFFQIRSNLRIRPYKSSQPMVRFYLFPIYG